MRNLEDLPVNFQELYRGGEKLLEKVNGFLDAWPHRKGEPIGSFERTPKQYRESADALIIDAKLWFNALKVEVIPFTLTSQNHLVRSLRNVELAVKKKEEVENYPPWETVYKDLTIPEAKQVVDGEIKDALSLILTIPPSSLTTKHTQQISQTGHTPNTAFIMMWMDASHPELDDVSNTIKQVCADFNVRALRADDVEHQDKITDVILKIHFKLRVPNRGSHRGAPECLLRSWVCSRHW